MSTECKHLNTRIGLVNHLGYGNCLDCGKEINLCYVFNNWLDELCNIKKEFDKKPQAPEGFIVQLVVIRVGQNQLKVIAQTEATTVYAEVLEDAVALRVIEEKLKELIPCNSKF